MNKVEMVLNDLYSAETELAETLRQVAERNRAEHEVYYLANDLAEWSRDHVTDLDRIARDRGLDLDGGTEARQGIPSAIRQKATELFGKPADPALQLLDDLRTIHAKAAAVVLNWEILARAAQALADPELVALAGRCQAQAQRQLRWSAAKVEESAAQTIAIA